MIEEENKTRKPYISNRSVVIIFFEDMIDMGSSISIMIVKMNA